MSNDATEPSSCPPDLDAALVKSQGARITRFLLNGLSGIIPGVGGLISGGAGAWSESEQDKINDVLGAWVKLQAAEIEEIGKTLAEVVARLDLLSEGVRSRVISKEYLSLVRRALRDWAASESEEKRVLVRNLLANAGSCELCSDDVVRLFVEWIRDYSEAHFKVIRDIYSNPRSTRAQIWSRIHGASVREDSAEADLFKLLIRDLSTGQVVRQERETTYDGQFLPERRRKATASRSTLTSAFDDDKGYVLTELGKQFVHYTMNEIVPRLAHNPSAPAGV